MKVLYLITKSEIGGAQTYIYQLCKYSISQGNSVAVMSYPGGWLEKKIKGIGANFYPNKFFSNAINPIRDLKALKIIKNTVIDFKPNSVSCHSTKAGFLTRLTIRNKIPTIFTAHGWAFTVGVPIWKKYLAILIEKIAGKFCSKIICVSNFDRNLALKYKIAPAGKLITIHNGVKIIQNDADVRQEDSERRGIINTQDDATDNASQQKLIKIVFVGRLGKQKDPLLLLEAFNILPNELQNRSQVSIIGDGPKREMLEKFVKENNLEDRVEFLGGISRENVFKTLRKSDIFVLISNWEGFPYTIIEAMSCGLPVIASDVGGIREAVNDDCGILVKRGDEEAIKNALEKLLKNPSLAKEMGEKSRARVKKEFSLEKTLRETEQIYKEMLRG